MGSMTSPSTAIDDMQFGPLPKKPTAGRIVCVGTTILMVGENGALYTNVRVSGKVCCAGRWDFSETLLEALDLMGLLKAEDKKRHADYLALLKDRSDAVEALCDATRAAKNPASGVKAKNLLAMWDKLDWIGQRNAERYHARPAGSILKPQPKD